MRRRSLTLGLHQADRSIAKAFFLQWADSRRCRANCVQVEISFDS